MVTHASWVGRRFGKVEGFNDGLSAGYSAAVFRTHGISPEQQKDFWDMYHRAREDRNIAEVHRELDSRRATKEGRS